MIKSTCDWFRDSFADLHPIWEQRWAGFVVIPVPTWPETFRWVAIVCAFIAMLPFPVYAWSLPATGGFGDSTPFREAARLLGEVGITVYIYALLALFMLGFLLAMYSWLVQDRIVINIHIARVALVLSTVFESYLIVIFLGEGDYNAIPARVPLAACGIIGLGLFYVRELWNHSPSPVLISDSRG